MRKGIICLLLLTVITSFLVGLILSTQDKYKKLLYNSILIINDINYNCNLIRFTDEAIHILIYEYNQNYYVELQSDNDYNILHFKLISNEFEYVDNDVQIPEDAIAYSVNSNQWKYDNVFEPSYDCNSDFDEIYVSLKNNIEDFCTDCSYETYELYICGHYEWDKSKDYENFINIVLVLDNKNIVSTSCYKENSQWYIGTPMYISDINSYKAMLEKVSATAVFNICDTLTK